MIATFSGRVSEVFSPTVPQTMRPETPSPIRRVHHPAGRLDVDAHVVPELRRDGRKDAFPTDSRSHRLSLQFPAGS